MTDDIDQPEQPTEPPRYSGLLHNIFADGTIEYDGVIGRPSDFPLTPAELAEVTSQNYQPSIDEKKRARILILKSACQAAIEAGFTSYALGSAHTYESKMPQDQSNLIGAKLVGVGLMYTCIDAEGTKQQKYHTAEQMAQVFADGMAWMQSQKERYYAKIALVNDANTSSLLEGITW